MHELRVPLQIGPRSVNGIFDGVADGLSDALCIVEDYTPHPERPSREYVLGFIIDKDNRTGVSSDVVEDVPVKSEVGFPLAGISRGIDFVE